MDPEEGLVHSFGILPRPLLMTIERVGMVALSLVLAACAAGCTSETASLAQAPASQVPGPGPRFDQSGPDADEYGAALSYPVGDRNSFFHW